MTLQTVATQSKYGLIKKGVNTNNPNINSKRRQLPIFKSDELEGDDDDDNQQNSKFNDIKRVNQQIVIKSQQVSKDVQKLYQSAKDIDESIYDYDGVYDSMKAEASSMLSSHPLSQTNTTNEPPKARYIHNLKVAAKLKEKDSDRVYERKLLKERNEGVVGNEFDDKPMFITTAYKERLKEKQQWEYEEKLQEEVDKRHDVRKLGMQGFYANLLTKNIALGGDVETSATSAFTVGSQRVNNIIGESKPVDIESIDKKRSHTDINDDNDAELNSTESLVAENVIDSNKLTDNSIDLSEKSQEKKEDKQTAILSARERYLQRKQQKLES